MPVDGVRAAQGRRLTVLVVEDEFLIADYLALILEEAGHAVLGPVGSAAGALALLDSGAEADVASLDVMLPGDMDGVGLAEALRIRGGPPHFFVTGSGDPVQRARCEATASLAVIQKPVNPEALLAVLAKLGPVIS